MNKNKPVKGKPKAKPGPAGTISDWKPTRKFEIVDTREDRAKWCHLNGRSYG